MKIYKSTNSIMVYNFFKIVETDDLRYLIKSFDDENSEIELTEEQKAEYAEIFNGIYYDYCEITQNFKLRGILEKEILIQQWSITHTIISSSLNIYDEYKDILSKESLNNVLDLINQLEDPKYIIKLDKPLDPQINKLVNKMKGLKNKIVIYKAKIAESLKNEKAQTKIDLDKDALYLERNLELGREIDPKKTTLARWVRMIQMSKEKHKKAQKHGRN